MAQADIGDVRLKGRFGERLDLMIERHVGGTDMAYITAPFQEKTETRRLWQTEFWGKYMHSAVPYADYSGSSKIAADIRLGVARILASQEPCGYIGNYPEALRCGEGWDVWGMKYTLMGLLHDYDALLKDEAERPSGGPGAGDRPPVRVRTAAKRLCDYVIGEIGPGGRRGRELWETGNWSGYASSSILEPVVWLYRRVAAAEGAAAAQKYFDFATYIVKGMADVNPKGPRLLDLALKGVSVADRNERGAALVPENGTSWAYVCKYGRGKAYEMMSCYQGLLDYAEELEKRGSGGDLADRLRKAAVMTAEDIVREEVTLAGGCASSEAWFHGARKQHLPYKHLQETCVTTTWMRFCEKLLETTDDPKWADQLELTFEMPVVAHLVDHHVAFMRGPVLLARDSRFGDGDMMEPFRVGLVDGQRMEAFASVRTPSDDFWMTFSGTVPIGSHYENPEGANPVTVFFCDYASAGNTWRRDDCYRTWFPIERVPESR